MLEQLDAIDKAIAALNGAPSAAIELVAAQAPPVPPTTTAAPIVPKLIKPKRVLGDSHRQALTEGRRKAQRAKDTASGLARQIPDESFVRALGGRGESRPPRLVKK